MITSVPNSVLSDDTLACLHPRAIGRCAMTCIKLALRARDTVLQFMKRIGLRRRLGETLGSLLFALHVMIESLSFATHSCFPDLLGRDISDRQQCAVFTFSASNLKRSTELEGGFQFIPKKKDSLGSMNILDAAFGETHSAFLTGNGEIYTLGQGPYKKGPMLQGVVQVPDEVKDALAALTLRDGTRVVQLGASGGYFRSAMSMLTNDGQLFMCTEELFWHDAAQGVACGVLEAHGESGQLFKVLPSKYALQIAHDFHHSAMLVRDPESDGDINNTEVYTWGRGSKGQLCHDSDENEPLPRQVAGFSGKRVVELAVGEDHTVALTRDGKVYACGSNVYGQLGNGRDLAPYCAVPRLVQALADVRVIQIATGKFNTLALSDEGEVFTWGRALDVAMEAEHGVVCDFNPRRVDLLARWRVVQVAAREFQSVALTSDGEVFTWGLGRGARLCDCDHDCKDCALVGNRYKVPRRVRALVGKRVVRVSTGEFDTAAVVIKATAVRYAVEVKQPKYRT